MVTSAFINALIKQVRVGLNMPMIQRFANLKTTTITTPSKGGRLDTTLTDERVE